MGKEIERKFLVDTNKLQNLENGKTIKQAYIPTTNNSAIRVRVINDIAYLTIKGANVGATRSEFEYPIPLKDALEIINTLCHTTTIEKTRYEIKHSNHTWEVDIFKGENEGLILAEVEIFSEEETVDIPEWATEEVTHDSRYYNSNLIITPFKTWQNS